MIIFDIIVGGVGIVMIVRLVQLLANASRRTSILRLGRDIMVVLAAMVLALIYCYFRVTGRV